MNTPRRGSYGRNLATRRIRSCASFLAAGMIMSGCGAAGPSSAPTLATPEPSVALVPSASPRPSPTPVIIEGKFAVNGVKLWIHCEGSGSPTVVLDAGLGSLSNTWVPIFGDIAATTRVCRYDRAGVGLSDARPGYPDTSAGTMAEELHGLLKAAAIDGPYVLVGHSYGGMIVRLFAHAHPDETAGVVLVDAASGHQFERAWREGDQPWAGDAPWYDKGTKVDRTASAVELAAVKTFGWIPLLVLTQGQLNGEFEPIWSALQDELATLSTNALHVVARDSGHSIQEDEPDLVSAGIRAVVESARSGADLPPCGPALEAVGAECLTTTMTALFEAWAALRASVIATAGDLPDGVYRAELTGAQSKAVTGQAAPFKLEVLTWTLKGGHWSVSIVDDGGKPDSTADVYAVVGAQVLLRLPVDWKIPRTPGVNRLTWTVDSGGTLHFVQVDGELVEAVFTVPWVRTGPAA